MGDWIKFRDELLARSPGVKVEYDKLGPRFAAISELIRARNATSISQSELARRMNVTPNTISRLESAEHSPRLDTLAAAAEAMGYEMRLKFVKPKTSPTATRSKPRKRTPASRPARAR